MRALLPLLALWVLAPAPLWAMQGSAPTANPAAPPAQPPPAKDAGQPDLTPEEIADQELQHRLLAAGIISEIKPPITDLTPYRNRRAIPIQGEPISETAIRERR